MRLDLGRGLGVLSNAAGVEQDRTHVLGRAVANVVDDKRSVSFEFERCFAVSPWVMYHDPGGSTHDVNIVLRFYYFRRLGFWNDSDIPKYR